MKKRIMSILMIVLVLSTGILSAGASTVETKVGFLVNDEIKEILHNMGQPFLQDSRTFVPLRFVSETLGFKVDWEQASRTATIHGSEGNISVQIGSKTVSTPLGQVTMDVEAFLKDGRTYVPIRFVAEALDFEVDWVPAKDVEDSINYIYDFYVTINGELGNTLNINDADENGITNIVSDDPADWPETDNIWQAEADLFLAKNKPYIDYMEKNYEGKFHIAGYSISGLSGIQLGSDLSFSPYPDQVLHVPAFRVLDMRHIEEGYIEMNVRWYDVSKDVIEKTLYAYAGYNDGKYIFDYYNKGRTESVVVNEWIETPSGREFQIDPISSSSGVLILLK